MFIEMLMRVRAETTVGLEAESSDISWERHCNGYVDNGESCFNWWWKYFLSWHLNLILFQHILRNKATTTPTYM